MEALTATLGAQERPKGKALALSAETLASRARRLVPAGLTAAVAIAAALATATASGLYAEATVSYEAAEARLAAVSESLEGELAEARPLADLEASDVSDPEALEQLSAALGHAEAVFADGLSLSEVGTSVFDHASVASAAESGMGRADDARDAARELSRAVRGVRESAAARSASDARDALASALEAARGTLSETTGKVADGGVTESLSSAISDAEQRAAAAPEDGATVSSYVTGTAALKEAASASASSHEQWQAQQAAIAAARARQAQAAAAASTRTGSTGAYAPSPSGTGQAAGSAWHVSYTKGGVDAAGGVREYADHYFVAHRSTGTNGKTIASRPSTVVVDGKTYRYVGETHATIGASLDTVYDWATANGGIAFQTCDGGNQALVTHYEPVG